MQLSFCEKTLFVDNFGNVHSKTEVYKFGVDRTEEGLNKNWEIILNVFTALERSVLQISSKLYYISLGGNNRLLHIHIICICSFTVFVFSLNPYFGFSFIREVCNASHVFPLWRQHRIYNMTSAFTKLS